MSEPQFNENASYRRYIGLLHELHARISSGKSDDADADEIRDQMDRPWYGLSRVEIDRVRGLSADLYSLEIKQDRAPAALTDEGRALCDEFQDALQAKQWDRALGVLRNASRFMKLSDVSFARGRIWRELGDYETAILFYQHAVALSAPELTITVSHDDFKTATISYANMDAIPKSSG